MSGVLASHLAAQAFWQGLVQPRPSGAQQPLVYVSACLLGECCRYDGGHCGQEPLRELAQRGLLLPGCPEVAGGLPVPRPPAVFQGGGGQGVLAGTARLLARPAVTSHLAPIDHWPEVTPAFLLGARRTLDVLRAAGIQAAILKEGSPSCGSGRITLEEQKVPGEGVTAALLRQQGIQVFSEETLRMVWENRKS